MKWTQETVPAEVLSIRCSSSPCCGGGVEKEGMVEEEGMMVEKGRRVEEGEDGGGGTKKE